MVGQKLKKSILLLLLITSVTFIALQWSNTERAFPHAARYIDSSADFVLISGPAGELVEALTPHLDRLLAVPSRREGDSYAEALLQHCVRVEDAQSLGELGVDATSSIAFSLSGLGSENAEAILAIPVTDADRFLRLLQTFDSYRAMITLRPASQQESLPPGSKIIFSKGGDRHIQYCDRRGNGFNFSTYEISDSSAKDGLVLYAVPNNGEAYPFNIECQVQFPNQRYERCQCRVTIWNSEGNTSTEADCGAVPLPGLNRSQKASNGGQDIYNFNGIWVAFEPQRLVALIASSEEAIHQSMKERLGGLIPEYSDDALINQLQQLVASRKESAKFFVLVGPLVLPEVLKPLTIPIELTARISIFGQMNPEGLTIEASAPIPSAPLNTLGKLARNLPAGPDPPVLAVAKAVLLLREPNISEALATFFKFKADAAKVLHGAFPLYDALVRRADTHQLALYFTGVSEGVPEFLFTIPEPDQATADALILDLQRYFQLQRDKQVLWAVIDEYRRLNRGLLPESLQQVATLFDPPEPDLLDRYADEYVEKVDTLVSNYDDVSVERDVDSRANFPRDIPKQYTAEYFNSGAYHLERGGRIFKFLSPPVSSNDLRFRYLEGLLQDRRSSLRTLARNLLDAERDAKKSRAVGNYPSFDSTTKILSDITNELSGVSPLLDEMADADFRSAVKQIRRKQALYETSAEKSSTSFDDLTASIERAAYSVYAIDRKLDQSLNGNRSRWVNYLQATLDTQTLQSDKFRLVAFYDAENHHIMLDTSADNLSRVYEISRSKSLFVPCSFCDEYKLMLRANPAWLIAQALLHPDKDIRSAAENLTNWVSLEGYDTFDIGIKPDGERLIRMKVSLHNE